MSYASIMVAADLGPDAKPRIELASQLARRFDARLIGVAARYPHFVVAGEPPNTTGRLYEAELQVFLGELTEVESLFRRAAGSHNLIEFRSCVELPTLFLIEQARAADLLVLGRQGPDDSSDWRFSPDPADTLMQGGRPLLMVPPGIADLRAQRILVAWRDGREVRRAVSEALPLLKQADEVLIVTVGDSPHEASTRDVTGYLREHKVRARSVFHPSREARVSDELLRLAEAEGSDLIISGGYGHSRMREWILGGVTRDLLDHSPVCCLLAH